jgi:hypothetical protein
MLLRARNQRVADTSAPTQAPLKKTIEDEDYVYVGRLDYEIR